MVKSTLFGVALLLILGCSPAGEGQPPSSAETEQTEGPLADVYGDVSITPEIAALDIKNVRLLSSNLLTGGQLSEEQMTQLQQLGYRTFINLRSADEQGTGWEEAYAEAAGITFHRLPIASARDINQSSAERLAGLLEQAGDEPVAIYCATGNRVGGLLAMKVYYVDEFSVEEAIAYGVKAGMTRLEQKIRGRLSVE
jgi:uncharacterized protein (TIGR01244 family)